MTEIVFADSSGAYPQTKQFDQDLKFSGYAIGYFVMKSGEKGGTGFIVKINSSDSALVLTTAHVFFNQFKYEHAQADFIIGGEAYLAEPIRTSLIWDNLDYAPIDPISKEQTSVPEDWTLCLIKKKPGMHYSCKIISLTLSDQLSPFSPGQRVHLIGYPKTFSQNDLNYISPEADPSKYDEILGSLCLANTIIDSKGRINEDGEMIAISCISANGMSGSPLIVKERGRYIVIGILHGGPASRIHNLVARVLSNSAQPFSYNIKLLSDYLLLKESQYIIDAHKEDLNAIIGYLNSLKGLTKMNREFFMIIYKMAYQIEIETGSQLKYNLAVPLRNIYPEILRF